MKRFLAVIILLGHVKKKRRRKLQISGAPVN
jgi:hypothetical protein